LAGDRRQPQHDRRGAGDAVTTVPRRLAAARSTPAGARALGLVAVVVAVVCFSVSSSIVKWAQTPGSVVAFWRMFLAVGAWWLVVAVQRHRRGTPPPSREIWARCAPAGLLFGANIAIFFTGVTKTSIAHAEFIGAVSPLLLVPAGAVFFGEHPNWRALRWGAVSIAGVAIVLAFGPSTGVASVGGDLLVLCAVVAWVAYLLCSKWARRGGLGVIEFMACVTPIGLLTSGPIALAIAGDEMWPLSARGWAGVLMLVLLTGIGAHGLVVFAQHSVPIATIGVMQSGQPALAVFWGWLILGEAIRPAQVPGMVMVIGGLAAFTLVSQRRPVPVAADEGPLDTDGADVPEPARPDEHHGR
jgi:drug/metabolite transporter (DMT)-like permease